MANEVDFCNSKFQLSTLINRSFNDLKQNIIDMDSLIMTQRLKFWLIASVRGQLVSFSTYAKSNYLNANDFFEIIIEWRLAFFY